MADDKCPECGNDDPKKIAGYEVQGVYDGVLYWICVKCQFAWPRSFVRSYLNIKSALYADKWNEERKED